jgi:hypothetical protein
MKNMIFLSLFASMLIFSSGEAMAIPENSQRVWREMERMWDGGHQVSRQIAKGYSTTLIFVAEGTFNGLNEFLSKARRPKKKNSSSTKFHSRYQGKDRFIVKGKLGGAVRTPRIKPHRLKSINFKRRPFRKIELFK